MSSCAKINVFCFVEIETSVVLILLHVLLYVLLHELQTNYTNYSSIFQLTKAAIRALKLVYCLAVLRLT
jgi:hypothetical protein